MTMPARVSRGTRKLSPALVIAGALGVMSLLAVGCGGEEGSNGDGTGGVSGTGASMGVTGSGGAFVGSGGFFGGSGGASSPGSGGATTTGSGGVTVGSGGAGTGSGGSSTASGGSQGSGGRGTGGTGTGTGGRGGASATGGASSGGASATGGASASGGALGSGGAASATGGASGAGGAVVANPTMNFFVSSDTSTTANLGGLAGADMRCQRLATAVGAGSKTWRAYLSAATPPTNAIDRIGPGPYYNSAGAMVATDKAALHARAGDAALFITERGARINGQWTNSPMPLEHDILTGTLRDGTIATSNTCSDWTATTGNSQVGHSDGFGPSMSTSGSYSYWNSAHTGQCGNTSPGGGAGRIYCFVGP